MDNTPIYIKMCRNAEEIQAAWRPKKGDYIFSGDEISIIDYEPDGSDKNYVAWIPRQDQLQEMLEDYDCFKDSSYTIFAKEFAFFVEHNNIGSGCSQSRPLNSMEQLWLAFVMKKKYNKTWDGEEWI